MKKKIDKSILVFILKEDAFLFISNLKILNYQHYLFYLRANVYKKTTINTRNHHELKRRALKISRLEAPECDLL